MIAILLHLLILALVIYIVIYILKMITLPEPARLIVNVILALIVIAYLLNIFGIGGNYLGKIQL